MGFIYALAVILVIFVGIIIQCEGTGGGESSNGKRGAPTIKIEENQKSLPNDLIDLTVGKTDVETILNAALTGILRPNDAAINRILQKYIIKIDFFEQSTGKCPAKNKITAAHTSKPHIKVIERKTVKHRKLLNGTMVEYQENGNCFLEINNYKTVQSFFRKLGDQVKKIEIWYGYAKCAECNEINNEIITKYANNLEELRFFARCDETFWKNILDGKNVIIFPKVKKFWIAHVNELMDLKLNLIFPELESLILIDNGPDEISVKNVKGLKELMLCPDTITEDAYEDIFKNNMNLTTIILAPENVETVQRIAEYLKELKIFEVLCPDSNFLIRKNYGPVYELASVTTFNIDMDKGNEIVEIENFSFDMPNLERLTMFNNYRTDDRIVNFINHFKKLESVELFFEDDYDAVKCIEKLVHIKEFTTTCPYKLRSLEEMFSKLDEKSNLQTLKLIYFAESSYETYEAALEKIVISTTWTLSHGEEIGTNIKYFLFRRKPYTMPMQVLQLSDFALTYIDPIITDSD